MVLSSPGTYHFALAEDGMTILFLCGTSKICFNKCWLCGVIGEKFHKSSSHVVAYSNAVQAMHQDKVIPDATGMYWGGPQVIHLQKKCKGTPFVDLIPYCTPGNMICRVQLAVQHV